MGGLGGIRCAGAEKGAGPGAVAHSRNVDFKKTKKKKEEERGRDSDGYMDNLGARGVVAGKT